MKNLLPSILSLFLAGCTSSCSDENLALTNVSDKPKTNISIGYPSKAASKVEFKPLLDLVPDGEIKLANGTVVDAKDWNAILVSKFAISADHSSYCTATVIGSNVVLTAAHCVDDGNSRSMPASINVDGVPISMICTMHPTWVKAGAGFHLKSDADYAVCLTSREIKQIAFENIDIQKNLAINDTVTLTGYGCTDVEITEDGELDYANSEGILRIGNDRIHATGYSSGSRSTGSMATTYSPKNTQPTLCPGDSGGPVFRPISAAKRSVVAVNSAVSWDGSGIQADFYSILAPLAQPLFTDFLNKWVQMNSDAKICGYNISRGTRGCKI